MAGTEGKSAEKKMTDIEERVVAGLASVGDDMKKDLAVGLRVEEPVEELATRVLVKQLSTRVLELESKMASLTTPPSNIGIPTPPETISATMVGGIFNCPECGLRISSPALISTQGLKTGGYYEHPFDDSPRLGGQKCRLIGRKFESPIVTLKMIVPKAPAPKVDIAENIGV